MFPGDAAAADVGMRNNNSAIPRAEQLKDELDDIVASECILCGEYMIKTIDQPFIGDDETEVLAQWSI